VAIAQQEARPFVVDGIRVDVPGFMAEIVATLTHLARESPHVNQASGVSVRLTVANMEVLVANATRRALRLGETDVVPRITDLDALAASTSGKIEIETLEEGRDGQIIDQFLRGAILTCFRETFDLAELSGVLDAFEERAVDAGEDISSAAYADLAAEIPALREAVNRLTEDESAASVASAVEFVLEGLHLSKRLNKEAAGGRATYRSRG